MLTDNEREVILSICRTNTNLDAAQKDSGLTMAAFTQYINSIKDKTGCDVGTFSGAVKVLTLMMFDEF